MLPPPPGQLGQNSGGRKEGHGQAAACWSWRVAAQPGVQHTSWDTPVTTSFLRHPPLAASPPLDVLGIPGSASAPRPSGGSASGCRWGRGPHGSRGL